jgi:hypothetical protein
VGVTALAGLSFLASKKFSMDGPEIGGARDFILACVDEGGFITRESSRMYEHALAMRFLAELQRVDPRQDVGRALEAATGVIVAAQNREGGWRYLPGAKDSDISVTACVLEALAAARACGIEVEPKTIARGLEYVKRSHIRDVGYRQYMGGFWYQVYENKPFRPSRTSYALTACGVAALAELGEVDSTESREGFQYLLDGRNIPPAKEMNRTFDYWYGHYEAAIAFSRAPEDLWNQWYPRVRDEIVAGQAREHYWRDLVGPNYATAMATLILQTRRAPR